MSRHRLRDPAWTKWTCIILAVYVVTFWILVMNFAANASARPAICEGLSAGECGEAMEAR